MLPNGGGLGFKRNRGHSPRGGVPGIVDALMIDARLLEILVCPACRSAVEPLGDESGLRCGGCRRVYPVRDGIPVMLVDQARPAPGEPEGP